MTSGFQSTHGGSETPGRFVFDYFYRIDPESRRNGSARPLGRLSRPVLPRSAMMLVSLRPPRSSACAALLLLLVVPWQASAQRAEASPYALAGSAVHRLESRVVGDTFEVSIAVPLGYEGSDRRYPVVIALDADLAFAATAQIARLMQFRQELPEFVLVGIGYGTLDVALEKRLRDFTPTVDETKAVCGREAACGGAERFLGFIESELLPLVAERYRVDSADLTLVGNSLGGLFGCYVLARKPHLFRRYLLGSPTVSWDRGWAIEAIRQSGAEPDLDARVFIGVGGAEGDGVVGARALADRLRTAGPPGISVWFHVFDEERHMSAQPMAVSRGLRVLFGTAPAGAPRPRP